MKHATFENELRDIRRRAINELKDALNAWGGHYSFSTWKKKPKLRWGDYVQKVFIDDKTIRVISVNMQEEEHICCIDRIYIEEILRITKHIPTTKEVEDVSGVYPVPVTCVDRDDIEMQGFNTDGMTQKDLEKLAERMCDIYNNGDFCSDLDLACKDCGLKEKED